jgi:hypothetical protein
MTLSGAPVGSRPSLLLTQLLSAPLPLGIIMNSKGPKILCLVEQPSLHETPCQSHWAIGAENRCSPPTQPYFSKPVREDQCVMRLCWRDG